ncbi:nuclear transport factor 2 family protein [Cupriavidus sp. 30B13]|uniref:nuclear transport factor 2 family protein n=1 Tax=Cupriavidus sp. 30B13 TaxID=3384241 RepID=UPI003B91B887
MNLPLPGAIAAFFEVSNGADDALLAHCFAQDAVVRDEGHAHEGQEAIRSWLREARRQYAYRVEPLALSGQGAGVTVVARVTGTFPGSPVQLAHVFRLRGERIASLEIRA